jgi:hypothetical protein
MTFSGDEVLPDEVVPTSWAVVESQGSQGACQGHALSTGVEDLVVRSGGAQMQLSRAAAYYMTQRIDNIRGDRGSTIEGGVRLAMTDGLPLEEVWRYPSSYNPSIPAGYESAPKWKIEGHTSCRNYDDVIRHIGLRGPVHIGIMWGGGHDQQVARDGIISRYAPGGGGHSVELVGYQWANYQGQRAGKRYVLLQNSWGEWGVNGFCLVTPDAIDQMIQGQWSVFEGLYGCIAGLGNTMPVYT